jgi:hypothetical protein
LFPRTSIEILGDDRTAKTLSKFELPPDYVGQGYRIERPPFHSGLISRSGVALDEYVVRSPEVDAFLRGSELPITEEKTHLDFVVDHLRTKARIFDQIIRQKYHSARGATPRQGFFNESKVGLASDIFSGSRNLSVFCTTYFSSVLTNDLVSFIGETVGPFPEKCYSGSDDLPVYPGDRMVLKSIADSYMNDHIGLSTVVITCDDKLVLWEQGAAALHSQHKVAPTGSGSCDWEDWLVLLRRPEPKAVTLQMLLTQAMEREFKEESRPFDRPLLDGDVRTWIIGHFRWLRRGGKPEFVAVSRTSKSSSELRPNIREVGAPKSLRTYPAESLDLLSSSVAEILKHETASVPLWVTMRCLSEMIERGESLDNFIRSEPP